MAIFPNVCLWRRSLCSNLAGIDPEKLYRAIFTSTAYVVASALVSVRPICKNLSNLQKIFGQMVYRLPLAKNSPYAYVVSLCSWPPTWPPWHHVQTRNFKFFKKWYWVRVVIFYCKSMSVFVDFSKNFWWSKTSESNGRGRVSFCLPSCRDRELQGTWRRYVNLHRFPNY